MNKKCHYRNIFLFIVLYAISIIPLMAQNNNRMLIHEIEGNRYVKTDYSPEGKQTGKQVLKVETIEKQNDRLRMPVKLYSYNKKGNLEDSTKTIYTCNPDERRILVNLLSFSDYGKGSEIKINLNGTNAFYPVTPEPGWEMESINFQMNIDKGLVGFLGGKSKVNIHNRRIVSNDTLQTKQYQINSEVNFRIYVIGIRMKEFGYRIIEIIDKEEGIIWQKFTSEDDDSYFMIRLL